MTDDQSIERERIHLNGLYRAIFEDDKRGETLLLDLQRRFVKAPNPNDFTQEGMLRTFVQTHQREVIEYIVRRINAAHGIPDLNPEGPPDE